MRIPHFAGLMGGKPKKAFFFVGAHEPQSKLIFLDPHKVQKHVPDINDCSRNHLYLDHLGRYHILEQDGARMLHMSKLDPCLGFGFMLKDRTDFELFKTHLNSLKGETINMRPSSGEDFPQVEGGPKLFNVFASQEEFISDLDSHAVQSYYSQSVRSSLLPPTDDCLPSFE